MSARMPGTRKPSRPKKRPSGKMATPTSVESVPKAPQVAKTERGIQEICLAIRLRGSANIRPEILQTLYSLRLLRKYSATLVEKRPDLLGMLKRAKDMITWGELSRDGLMALLEKRARLPGNERLTDEWVRQRFNYHTIDELAGAIAKGEVSPNGLWSQGIKPVFRLHPPKGGFKYTTKRHFRDMGELGYRGPLIDQLVLRMV